MGPNKVSDESVTLKGIDGNDVGAFHAWPQAGLWGSLVIHPDVQGLEPNPLFFDISRRFASHGLAVCTVEPFARSTPDVRAAWGFEPRVPALMAFDDAVQIADLANASTFLDECHRGLKTGLLGFCLGGTQVFKTVATGTGRFDAAVSCYPTLEGYLGPKQRHPLQDIENASCPTLAIIGGDDAVTPPSSIEALEKAWANRPDCEVYVYKNTPHAFIHDPDSDMHREMHRPEQSADAWKRILAWYERHLRP
jgi:carboxymethylenebutenolidase